MDSFAENGIDPFFYTARRRSFDEVLPWDHMDYGVTKKFLIRENEKAHRGETTASCREKCAGCGAARLNGGVLFKTTTTEYSLRRKSQYFWNKKLYFFS